MRILFVYQNIYSMGGIQTWLARMLPALRGLGHEIEVLVRQRGRPWDTTDAFADALRKTGVVHVAGRNWFSAPSSYPASLGPVDVIFPCSLDDLLLGGLVQTHRSPEAKLVSGMFAPREYCWKAPRWQRHYVQRLGERWLREAPVANMVFIAESMVRQNSECIGRDLTGAPIVPLAIDTESVRPVAGRTVDRRKIVSVARLVSHYTHHAHMLHVIRELRDGGHAFTYHAVGDGELRPELERLARELDVEDAITFHGSVPYEQVATVTDDAFAYIGLGTGLIEAAARGIPGLVGIDSHPGPYTYGLLHETTGYDIGGYVPGHAKYPIAERILWLASRSGAEYDQIAAACRARAEEFSLARLAPELAVHLEAAAPFRFPVSAADRLLGAADFAREAGVLKLGGPATLADRHVRA